MSWIQTYTGLAFDFDADKPRTYRIEDIAHSLASQARYNGHTREPYSVAQHSVVLAWWWQAHHEQTPENVQIAKDFLMHDAGEAYYGDLVRPLIVYMKQHGVYGPVQELKDRINREIAEHFGLSHPEPAHVLEADIRITVNEAAAFMAPPERPWGHHPKGALTGDEWTDTLDTAWPWHVAERLFLDEFATLWPAL